MSYRRYHGSCHCQAVRYEATFDVSAGSNRCNCSICTKARAWFLFVKDADFKLLDGDESLSTYEWIPPGQAAVGLTYRFCSRCGIRVFASGELEALGGRFHAIHVPTLDDVNPDELVKAPINYFDQADHVPSRVVMARHLL